MIGYNVKITFRIMGRQRLFTAINVIGLGIGLVCFVLFFLSWRYERSFDRFHASADRIYRVEMDWGEFGKVERTARSFPGMAMAVREEIPQIEYVARLRPFRKSVVRREDKIFLENGVSVADREIFDIFTIPVKDGDVGEILAGPDSVVLSESAAKKYFGDEDPIGKTLNIALNWGVNRTRAYDFSVAGVMADLPSNSTYRFDFLIPAEIMNRFLDDPEYLATWRAMPDFTTFVRAREDAPIADIEDVLTGVVQTRSGRDSIQSMVLNPLTSLHKSDPSLSKYLAIFGTIALIVLLLACVNSINLSTAQAMKRIKEVGVKKIAGADRSRLIRQFMTESFLMVTVALAAALVTLELILPAFRTMAGRELRVQEITNPGLLAALAGIGLVVALASGLYPAFYLSGIRPVELFGKSRTEKTSRSLLGKGLVFVQFAFLGILLAGTLAVARQLTYIENADLGMNKDNIMVLRMDDVRLLEKDSNEVLRNELEELPSIKNISSLFVAPPNLNTEIQIRAEDASDSQRMFWILQSGDAEYLETFSVELLEGRNISPGPVSRELNEVLVNETAVRRLGSKSPIGRKIRIYFHGEKYNSAVIVGVIKDFHGRSLHHPIEPLIIEKTTWGTQICLRIQDANTEKAVTAVSEVWKRIFPDNPIDYFFLEDGFRAAYRSEERLGLITRTFSGLAFFIACLGLFGLVSFSTERRRKEMGIRKVLGANFVQLLGLFFRDFSWPVLLSNIAAWPIAFMAIQRWLRGFAFRTNTPIWIFIVGGVVTVSIALLTVWLQVQRAHRLNPVESLRYE